jgi:UDP-N-acetylglucosamine 2-epimerase
LRKETEWIELVANGTVKLADANPEHIRNEFAGYMNLGSDLQYPGFYGDGKTAEFILKEVLLLFEKYF